MIRKGPFVLVFLAATTLNSTRSHSQSSRGERVLAVTDRTIPEPGVAGVAGVDGVVAPSIGRRSPSLAWMFSLIHPGVGQFYNKEVSKGVAMLTVGVVGEVLMVVGAVTSCSSTSPSTPRSSGYIGYDTSDCTDYGCCRPVDWR